MGTDRPGPTPEDYAAAGIYVFETSDAERDPDAGADAPGEGGGESGPDPGPVDRLPVAA